MFEGSDEPSFETWVCRVVQGSSEVAFGGCYDGLKVWGGGRSSVRGEVVEKGRGREKGDIVEQKENEKWKMIHF